MECPNCGAYNEEEGKTCIVCGAALPAGAEKPRPEKTVPEKATSEKTPAKKNVPAHAAPTPTPASLYQPVPVSRISLTWGPFASYGQRTSYGGWLVEGQAAKAPALLEAVRVRFAEQYSPAAQVFLKAFTGAGSQAEVEARNYLLFRRGQVSAALNIVPFGRDIFLSSAIYAKAPLSRLKLGISLAGLLLGLLFFFFFPPWVAQWSQSFERQSLLTLFRSPGNVFNLLFVLCLLTPLMLAGLALSLFLLAKGLIHWVTEADLLAPWRMKLNEFQQDDALALNRTLELTLRAALRDCALDPSSLSRIFPHP